MSHEIHPPPPEDDDDPERTEPGTPLTKIVDRSLSRGFVRLEKRLCKYLAQMRTAVTVDVVNAISKDIRIVKEGLKLSEERQGDQELEMRALRRDIDRLTERFDDFCRRHADTSMLPPPPSGAG